MLGRSRGHVRLREQLDDVRWSLQPYVALHAERPARGLQADGGDDVERSRARRPLGDARDTATRLGEPIECQSARADRVRDRAADALHGLVGEIVAEAEGVGTRLER